MSNWPAWAFWLAWAALMLALLFLVLWPRTSAGVWMTPAGAADYYDEHAHHWTDLRKIALTMMILLGYGIWLLLRRRF